MRFTRKENRPDTPFSETNPCGPDLEEHFRAGRRVPPGGRRGNSRAGDRGGGKAPFICRALALPLSIIPLITLLIISFHLLTSPVLAAGGEAPPKAPSETLSFQWPARGEVLTPFRSSDGPYGSGGHAGIDISLSLGSEVYASAQGTVSFAGNTPLGLCVSVTHADGLKTTYVALGATSVRQGERVERGQAVGESEGSKDRSCSSPHLHFGLFLSGRAIDPLPLLQGCLLDPNDCLFLGPWEDKAALEVYLSRHNQNGLFDWMGRGLKRVGGAVAGACKTAAGAVGGALDAAWSWTCRVAGGFGRAFQTFYRGCIQPWLSPILKGVAAAAKWVWLNRYVQALVAGLAAAAIICLVVLAAILTFGVSLVAGIVAAIIGSVAAIAYALYYAFASGDSFSFAGCFLSSLVVGGAAAASSLLVAYMAPLIGAGWSQLGWIGVGKAFLINGAVDSLIYIVFCLATGREISPLGLLATFLLGGLMGGVGKLFMSGLFAEGTIQALAAGFLSSGGAMLSGEGVAGLTAYAWAITVRFTYKAAYVFFCGCTGFLADLVIRISIGGVPSVLESLLSFAGGALAGGLGLMGGGKGVAGLLSRLSRGRLKITSDLVKAVVGKCFSKGLREGLSGLIRRLKRGGKKLDEGLWWSEMGGDL